MNKKYCRFTYVRYGNIFFTNYCKNSTKLLQNEIQSVTMKKNKGGKNYATQFH